MLLLYILGNATINALFFEHASIKLRTPCIYSSSMTESSSNITTQSLLLLYFAIN